MDELIQAMSIPELQGFKETYKSNPSIVKIVDGYIEIKTKEAVQVKAKEEFQAMIGDLTASLPHPDGVHNIYMAWREVEIEDREHGEDVTIPKLDGDKPVLTAKGKPVMVTVTRYPKVTIAKWCVELNKGFQVGKQSSSTDTGKSTTSKRAITVSKRESPDSSKLVLVGHFPSASKACEYLKLTLGGDSGTRCLQREGYFLEGYTGTGYTGTGYTA